MRCSGCPISNEDKPKQKPYLTVSDSIASRALTFDMRISFEQHVLVLADLRDLISVLTCRFLLSKLENPNQCKT